MHLLVSVAGPTEARAALRGGADVIDAKDPRRGALGPVPRRRLAAHAAGLFAALAGGLSDADFPTVRVLGADLVGVRGAACVGGRTGRIAADRVAALRALTGAPARVAVRRAVLPQRDVQLSQVFGG